MAASKFTTVRVSVEAAKIAKIAAPYKEMNTSEYISWLVLEYSHLVIDAGAKSIPRPKKRKAETDEGP